MAQLSTGHLAMRALTQAGLEHLFTLSGGHIFPLYEGCRHEGVRLIDVRTSRRRPSRPRAWAS